LFPANQQPNAHLPLEFGSEIEMLYIDEGYRCSGIGRCLVDEFKKWSNDRGAGILRVGALAANKHARDFYEKWGFAEAEIMYEIVAPS
ncbi:MAG TPA: GNAT family N-acetyltransferase, partial [Acidimicrobiia bacterium]|nr:GNAT family N-acetyltransferase [Acidimicrobiia bacterium]